LKDRFAQKADNRELGRVRSEKASKTDIEKVNVTIETLHHRLKQISILQSELAKSILPSKPSGSFKATENINTKL